MAPVATKARREEIKIRSTSESFNKLVDLISSRFNAPEGVSDDQVIFVFGAGASLESGCPSWGNASLRRKLIEAVGGGNEQAFVAEAWSQLSRLLPTSRSGVGTHERTDMLVSHGRTDHLCGVAKTLADWHARLLAFLQDRYQPPKQLAGPQLAYELTAHLIKHRFVDHVVSLNFDEVLDAALEDELGADGYETVLPGGPKPQVIQSLPYLFKLHGTISNVDSLRFATKDTGMLSTGIVDVLDQVVFHKGKKNKSWIVSLGYSWTDPDLLQWLAVHSANIAGIVTVALDDKPAHAISAGFAQSLKRHVKTPEIFSISTLQLVHRGPSATVDEVLWAAWKETRNRAKERKRVPSAARHLLVSHLFPSKSPNRRWPSIYAVHNAQTRFEAEVFLTLGKTDGMITLSSLARDGRIVRHWSPEIAKSIKRQGSVLDKFDFVKRTQDADMTEVYLYKGQTGQDYASHFSRNSGRTLSFSKTLIGDFGDKTISVPEFDGTKIRRKRQKYSHFLEHYLKSVFDGPSVEVDPGQDLRTSFLYTATDPLPTHKALRDKTHELITCGEWSSLLVIAESGHWLQEYQENFQQFQEVFLIEASTFGVPDWKLRRPVSLDSHTATIGIPWWVHNRHLTLAISRDGRVFRGIYFRRRQRTPRISPIALVEKADLQQLLKIFLAYSTRFLEARGRWSGGPGLPIYPDAERFFDGLQHLDLRLLLGNEGPKWRERLSRARSLGPLQ